MYRMEIATENTPSKKAFWVPLQISHPCPCLHALWLTLAVRWRGKVSSRSLDYLSWALKTHLYSRGAVECEESKSRVKSERRSKQMDSGEAGVPWKRKGKGGPCGPGDFPFLVSDPRQLVLRVTSFLFKVSQMSVFSRVSSWRRHQLTLRRYLPLHCTHAHSAPPLAGTGNPHYYLPAFGPLPLSSPSLTVCRPPVPGPTFYLHNCK